MINKYLNTLNSGILQQHKHCLRMNLYTLFLFIIPTVLSSYHVWSPTSSFAFLLAQWSDQSETANAESYAILPGKRICRGNGLLFYLVIYRCTVALHILGSICLKVSQNCIQNRTWTAKVGKFSRSHGRVGGATTVHWQLVTAVMVNNGAIKRGMVGELETYRWHLR